MSSASLKSPMFSLPTPKYSSLLKDDMCQKKFEVAKFKAQTKNGGSVDYKQTNEYKFNEKAEKKDNFVMSDELKVAFPYRSVYSQLRVNRKGDIRVHVDLGNFKVGKEQNFYTQLRCTDKYDKFWLRLGSNFTSKICSAKHRFERDFSGDYQFSYQNVCRYPSFVFGFATIFNLSQLKVQRYNAVFAYTHNKFEVALQHETPKSNKAEQEALNNCQLGRLTAGVNYKHNDNTSLALQFRRVFSKQKDVTINAGVAHKLDNGLNLKLKVNQQAKISASMKYKLDNTISLTAATTLALTKEGGPFATNQLIPMPMGYQIDINI